MGLESIFPHTVFYVFGIPIRDTALQGLFIVIAVGIAAALSHDKYLAFDPSGWQLAIESLVEYVEQLVVDMGGRAMPEVMPLLVTLLVFIGTGNLLGMLPGLQAPTRDLNTTLALSLVALGSWVYFGVRARGLGGYLKSFIEPMVFMLPLNLLSLFSRLLSMALRLFGNIFAGEVIGGVIFMLVPVLAPLPLALLSMITSVLQALVFTILTFVFIVDAVGEQEEEEGLGQEEGRTTI